MNAVRRVYLLGAGGFSKQVIDAFLASNITIGGIFDDYRTGIFYRHTQILGSINSVESTINHGESLFITFGDNNIRHAIATKYLSNYDFPNCIRPNSDIPHDTCKLGRGNYIGSYVKLGEDSIIGDFNFINECAILAHDTCIGNFNHLCPNVSLGGNARIGDCNLIGTGAVILPKIEIGNNNSCGAGSVIIRNIENAATYVGNPARQIK
jgi:acetyltransferase EpsM